MTKLLFFCSANFRNMYTQSSTIFQISLRNPLTNLAIFDSSILCILILVKVTSKSLKYSFTLHSRLEDKIHESNQTTFPPFSPSLAPLFAAMRYTCSFLLLLSHFRSHHNHHLQLPPPSAKALCFMKIHHFNALKANTNFLSLKNNTVRELF